MLSSGLRKVMKALLILLAAAWITTEAFSHDCAEEPIVCAASRICNRRHGALRPLDRRDDRRRGLRAVHELAQPELEHEKRPYAR